MRQVETANLGNVDDGFIPFELTRKLQRSSAQDVVKQEGNAEHIVETVRTRADSASETLEQHRHADIVINDAVSASVDAETNRSMSHVPPSPEWVKPAAQKPLSRKQKTQRKAQDSSPLVSEDRRSRKDRRMQQVLYKANSTNTMAQAKKHKVGQRECENATESEQQISKPHSRNGIQIDSVLAKLDRDLGGPSIIRAQQRRAERLATKLVEKRRKAELTATKKHEEKQQVNAAAEVQRKKKAEPWMRDKSALQAKFGAKGWAPNKRLSPDSLEGIRALHSSDSETYDTAMLSRHFQITPEAIRRILKSKWKPQSEEIEKRMKRWEARGVKKWREMSELGMKPPQKWRMLGVPNPRGMTHQKWEDNRTEPPMNQRTGKKERWRNLEQQHRNDDLETSLAHRL